MEEPLFSTYRCNWESVCNRLTALKNTLVDGFYRFSDAENEVYLTHEIIPDLTNSNTSFLYEAAFYMKDKKSISIRQYNDFWLWTEVDWNGFSPDDESHATIYNLVGGQGKKLRFHTHYQTVANCEFSVLQPAWNAFIGFQNTEEK